MKLSEKGALFIRVIIFCLLSLFLSACYEGNQHVEKPAHSQRWQQIRANLQQQLGEKYSVPIPKSDQKQLERGRELYFSICVQCHGKRGQGDGPVGATLEIKPSDLADPVQATFFSEQARLQIIRQGLPDAAMQAWAEFLTEEEIIAVYGYIRSLARTKN